MFDVIVENKALFLIYTDTIPFLYHPNQLNM
jgi:hypothetical protein